MFCKKSILQIFRKIHKKILEVSLIKLQILRPATLLKRDSSTKNTFFHRTSPVASSEFCKAALLALIMRLL